MRIRSVIFCLTASILAACSNAGTDPIHLDTPDNTKEIGTVISRDYAHDYDTNAVGDTVHDASQSGTQSAAMSAAGGNVVGAGTSALGAVGNTLTLGIFQKSINKNGIAYTIRKDDGEVVVVNDFPNTGDDIFFPGQRVIIQHNGQYNKVIPLIN
jgi:outer membrane lipoprotein SlyB